jgi:hypothetical protein
LKTTRTTEFGNIWTDGNPKSVHERLGNAWWAWMAWVFTLEETATYIGERSFHIEDRKGEVVMPLALCVRAMLLGYAIECALKGLWVKKGNKIVIDGKYARVAGAKDHDLMQLSKAVAFLPTIAEGDVLHRLSKFVKFAGRYPVAKTPDEMRPCEMSVIGKVDVGFFSKRDFRTAQSILNKIISQISGKKRRAIPQPGSISWQRKMEGGQVTAILPWRRRR